MQQRAAAPVAPASHRASDPLAIDPARSAIGPPASDCLDDRDLELAVVRDTAGLDALAAEWTDLAEAASATLFQTWEWQRAWWGFFAQGRELRCLVLRRRGRLVGIAPLVSERVGWGPLGLAVRWRFLGHPHTPYHDVLARAGHENDVLEAVAGYLHDFRDEWDILDVDSARGDSLVVGSLPAVLRRHGMLADVRPTDVRLAIRLPGSWPEFLQGLGKNGRTNFRRHLSQLSREHHVEVEWYDGEKGDLALAVEEFARIHEQRWASLGHRSPVRDRSFYLDLLTRCAPRGWLRVCFLRVDGLRVAVNMDFAYQQHVSSYLGHVFGPDPVMRHSPGFLLTCLSVERAIAEGNREYDLMAGDHAYKSQQLKARAEPLHGLRVRSPRGRARARAFACSELASKAADRLQREYHEVRRLYQRHALGRVLSQALLDRLTTVGRLGFAYLGRNF